jgi:predicted RNase H-like nuclease
MYSTAPQFHLQDFSRVRSAGIDGCRGGWIAVSVRKASNTYTLEVETLRVFGQDDFEALVEVLEGNDLVLIDIPIGLPDRGERLSDFAVRKVLGPRGRSIFPIPVRDAVYAETYEEACRINAEITGKKISRQTWNILPKIRTIDTFLRSGKDYRHTLRESSPEYCFALTTGRGDEFPRQFFPAHSKRSREGMRERSDVLDAYIRNWKNRSADVLSLYPGEIIAADDLTDAGILAVSAFYASVGRRIGIPPKADYDGFGLPVQAVFGLPEYFVPPADMEIEDRKNE